MAISSDLGRGPAASAILPPLARHWWVFLVRGLVAIAFGLVALFYPAATLVTFILFYGIFALVDGVFAVVSAIRGKEGMGSRWWLALVGVLGIVVGLVTFFWPGITALALLAVIGAWAKRRAPKKESHGIQEGHSGTRAQAQGGRAESGRDSQTDSQTQGGRFAKAWRRRAKTLHRQALWLRRRRRWRESNRRRRR